MNQAPAYGSGLTSDSQGNLYAVGGVDAGSGKRAIQIRKSSDNGVTWALVDQYQRGGDESTSMQGQFGTDAGGNVFLHAVSEDAQGDCHWLVRKGAANGTSWSTIDDWVDPDGGCAVPFSLAVGPAFQIYAAGVVWGGASGKTQMVVRKSGDGGFTWQVVDRYQVNEKQRAWAHSIAVSPDGVVYVAAFAGIEEHDKTDSGIIRKSTDFGSSWSTLTPFSLSAQGSTQFYGIAVAPNGDVYAVGSGDSQNTSHWLVRKSSDQGTNWVTADDFYVEHQYAAAVTVAVSQQGVVYVGGTAELDGNKKSAHWIVRSSVDNGATWLTTDVFGSEEKKMTSLVYGIAFGKNGSVFSCGYADHDGKKPIYQANWVVRKN